MKVTHEEEGDWEKPDENTRTRCVAIDKQGKNMKNYEEIVAEIAELQEQAANIMDAIGRIKKKCGIWCKNCKFYDAYCPRRGQFPACFQPDEEWRKKYECSSF